MRTLIPIAVLLLLAAAQAPAIADPEELDASDQDDALLLAYKEGREKVKASFYAIHKDPVAGQGADYVDENGVARSYRVAFVRGTVCTVEHQLAGTAVVVAVEFETAGPLADWVLRAWAGRKGTKPFPVEVEPIITSGSGGRGARGPLEITDERFADFEQGGLTWSGKLTTTKYWKSRKRGEPDQTQRVWRSDLDWFQQSIRIETEVRGSPMVVHEMTRASLNSPSLLDWTDVPEPAADELEPIRARLSRQLARADLKRMVSGNMSFSNVWGLHPNAKVGDWAEYGAARYTLVKLEHGRGIVESGPMVGSNLVESIEFKVENGKATEVVARFVGIKGEPPIPAKLSIHNDRRPLEVSEGKEEQVEIAGRTWKARQVTRTRRSLAPERERDYSDVEVRTISEDAPFGRPLKYKSYYLPTPDAEPQDIREWVLTATGDGGKPALDWSAWRPTPPWELPFTADDVKKFIKVGMKWRCKQELDQGEEGIATCYQDWEVKEVTDSGYRVEVVLTQPDGSKHPLEASYTWDDYVDRFRNWPRGTVEKKVLKLGERELEVVFYRFHTFGKDVLFGLSADLPGIRIGTEELLTFPSKTWLTEFTTPEAAKD